MTGTDTHRGSLLEAARRLAPSIRAQADQIDQARALPPPLFEALADAGLFHMAMPRSIGGGELELPTYIKVIEALALADASTAWAVNQGAIFATYSAMMPPEIARQIWFETPRGVVSNTPVAVATATVVPGGYRVSGRCGYSTGSPHASWFAPRAKVIDQQGDQVTLPNGEPDIRYLFVPVAEAELLDTWHTRGLRGTGTHHFQVNDVFVPAERSVHVSRAPLYEPGPLYTIPRTLLFASGDASVALGTARSALNAFIELAGGKTPTSTPGLLRDQPMAQAAIGQADAFIRSGRALLHETVRETWQMVTINGQMTLEQRAAHRLATTHPIRLAVQAIDTIYNLGGGTVAFDGNPLQRAFQDIHVISQHVQSRLAHYELIGRFHLGLEIDESRL